MTNENVNDILKTKNNAIQLEVKNMDKLIEEIKILNNKIELLQCFIQQLNSTLDRNLFTSKF